MNLFKIGILSVSFGLFAVTLILGTKDTAEDQRDLKEVVRIAFPYSTSIKKFDPQIVNVNSEANLARNLYSRLVEFDRDGKIQTSLASEAYVENGAVYLKIRSNLKTIDGVTIGPKDVVATLSNIFRNDQATHGSLRNILGFTAGDRFSDFVSFEGNQLQIRPARPELAEFILPLLASADFSIVPEKARRGGRIIDYRNTSGVYYLERDSEVGELIFAANPHHYNYSKEIPQKIQLVPVYGEKALVAFEKGHIDFIPTVSGGRLHRFKEISQRIPGVQFKQTDPFRLTVLKTTVSGRERFSDLDRLYIGQKVKEVVLKHDSHLLGGEVTQQFFPVLSEARLKEKNIRLVEDRIKKALTGKPPKKRFKLAVGPGQLEERKKQFAHLDFIKIVASKKAPWTLPKSEEPDGYVVRTDSSFYASLALVTYLFRIGSFGDKEAGDHWIKEFVGLPVKKARIEKMRRLHLKVLSEGIVTPIVFNPYYTLTAEGLDFKISKFQAGSKFWDLRLGM